MAVDCGAVLARQTVESSAERVKTDLSWMKLVNSSNYEQFKQSMAATVPTYFDGDYQSFDEKRSSFSNQEWFSYSTDEARTSFMAYFPKEAYQAWSDCVLAQEGSDKLVVGAHDADPESAVIVIRWEPTTNTLGALRNLQIKVYGGLIPKDQQVTEGFAANNPTEFVGQSSFLVKRSDPRSAIKITVNATTATGLGVQGFCTIFPPPSPPELQSWTYAFGAANSVTQLTPTAPRGRRLAISARSTDAFEEWGDPWHDLAVQFDGRTVFYLREGTQSNENELKMPERVEFVPASKSISVKLIHENWRTKATGLFLSVRELD